MRIYALMSLRARRLLRSVCLLLVVTTSVAFAQPSWAADSAGGIAPALKPSPRVCVPNDAMFQRARLDGALIVCSSGSQCWRHDLASRAWTTAPTLPDDAVPHPPGQIEVTPAGFKLCGADAVSCETLILPGIDTRQTDASITAATNSDRSLLAVFVGTGPVRVFDLKTRKQLYVVKPQKLSMQPSFATGVQFAGPALYVKSAATPISTAGRLYRARTGTFLADIGRAGAEIDEVPPLMIGPDRYVFATWMMERLVIIDVRTGKVLRRIPLGGSIKNSPDNVTLVLLAITAARQIVLVATSKEYGIQIINPDTGKRSVINPPRC